MLPAFEENEKIGLLDMPINSRTPKQTNIWRLVASILAVILIFVLSNDTMNKYKEVANTHIEGSFPYSERVRANVAKLLKNRTAVQYQTRDGPLRPFNNEYSKYPIANQYNLSACFVAKVLSTSLNSIFCYLRDPEGFEKEKLDLRTVYVDTKFCEAQTHGILGSTAMLLDKLPARHFTFQLVRDPIRRFVSAFVNKCVDELKLFKQYNNTREVCFGCNDDIECTVRKAYKEMVDVSRRERMFDIWAVSKDYYTEHFMPLTWYCDISTRSDEIEYIRYISHGEKKREMTNNVIKVMKKAGVEPEKLDKIQNFLSDDSPLTHATKGTSLPSFYLNKIYNSPEMLETLKKMYHYDYFVFEYPVPQLGKIEPET